MAHPSSQEYGLKMQNHQAGPKTKSKPASTAHFEPKLVEEEGLFQIGPEDECCDVFVLSVTIAFATRLEQLSPSDKRPKKKDDGYFFYYTLFGSDVTNDPFPSLKNAVFVPERASVRIRTSKQVLRSYLGGQESLKIYLCIGDHSLGNADVPINNLLQRNVDEIDTKPMVLDGAFQIHPPNIVKRQIKGKIEAKVGVSVCVRREEMPLDITKVEDDAKQTAASPAAKLKPPAVGASLQNVPQQELEFGDGDHPVDSLPESPVLGNGNPFFDVKSPAFVTEDEVESILDDGNAKTSGKQKRKTARPQTQMLPNNHFQNDTETNHYRFSLHLKSIENLEVPFTCNAFLKYSYPFFGSAAPIITNPPVQVTNKNHEARLPRSLCTFDFACSPSLLHNTFTSVPLVVELMHKDKDREDDDVLIGSVTMPLASLLVQEPVQFVTPTNDGRRGKEGLRLCYFGKVEIKSVKDAKAKVADLNVFLTLEDLGLAEKPKEQTGNRKSPVKTKSPTKPAEQPRKTVEYKAALELELWKEQKELEFENNLKQKEMAYMQSLAEEWQRRDREREAILCKKISEYNKLESKLQKSLADIGIREKRLADNELELSRIRVDVQREQERILAEAKESTNRMKQDCVHQVQIEKSRSRLLEEEITKLKSHLIDIERRYAALQKKYEDFQMHQQHTPEVQLRSQITLIQKENAELERKIESVNKSKLHYKQQWGRALKELAQLKQREHELALASLKRQQDELEQMRLRYSAEEEVKANKEGQKQLQQIKNELRKLKLTEKQAPKQDTIMLGPTIASEYTMPHAELRKVSNNVDEHKVRLIEERDTLLRTGVYTRDDRIIVELDRQIGDLVS